MSLRSIALTALIILAVWYWLRAREIKEQSFKAAAKYCDELSLKLLDDSVVLKQIRPVRSSQGHRCLQRLYLFEFTSTGEDRYQGEIVLIGRKVEHIKLQPHRVE